MRNRIYSRERVERSINKLDFVHCTWNNIPYFFILTFCRYAMIIHSKQWFRMSLWIKQENSPFTMKNSLRMLDMEVLVWRYIYYFYYYNYSKAVNYSSVMLHYDPNKRNHNSADVAYFINYCDWYRKVYSWQFWFNEEISCLCKWLLWTEVLEQSPRRKLEIV